MISVIENNCVEKKKKISPITLIILSAVLGLMIYGF